MSFIFIKIAKNKTRILFLIFSSSNIEVKKNYKVPVIASGGIMTASDALEFIIAGADMVAVGTANFINPSATFDILEGVKAYCSRHRIERIADLRGSFSHS